MPIKERIIKELQSGPKKYKALKTKFKATKKFFAAMEELYQQGIIDEVNGLIILLKGNKEEKKNNCRTAKHAHFFADCREDKVGMYLRDISR